MAVTTVFGVAQAPLAAQALVGWLRTGRWLWPRDPFAAVAAVWSRGEFGVGLPGSAARALPSSVVLWALSLLCAVVVGVLVWWASRVLWRAANVAGDGSYGLAGRREAASALGREQLRERAAVVRPDLRRRPWWR